MKRDNLAYPYTKENTDLAAVSTEAYGLRLELLSHEDGHMACSVRPTELKDIFGIDLQQLMLDDHKRAWESDDGETDEQPIIEPTMDTLTRASNVITHIAGQFGMRIHLTLEKDWLRCSTHQPIPKE